MEVLGICCSLRKGGNTEILVKEALKGAKEAGANIEFLTLIGKEIKPCDGCYACTNSGECHIQDDMQPIYKKLLNAEGIILGTPVYFWNMTGQAKILLDRTFCLRYPELRLQNKVGGIVVVASRKGLTNTAMSIQTLYVANHMILSDYVAGLARDKGAIRKDDYAMNLALEMGKQIVALISKEFRFAEGYNLPDYEYIKEKYGASSPPFG